MSKNRSNATTPRHVAELMLSWLGLELVSCSELQTLWAGYGHICAITAVPSRVKGKGKSGASTAPTRLILKLISPPPVTRRGDADEGHLRKMLSYEVEQYFYHAVAPRLPRDVAVAGCVASTWSMAGKSGAEELTGLTAMLLEDLRAPFPVAGEKRAVLSSIQVRSALSWLAKFHGCSWNVLPTADLSEYVLPPLEEARRRGKGAADDPMAGGSKLWLNGGYTYLATRRSELASLADDTRSEWCRAFLENVPGAGQNVAEMAAQFLTPSGRAFETYIHGDVKSENLFTTRSGDAVAFFDFQYAGIGVGTCDLAKLFTCSVPPGMLTEDEHAIPDRLPMDAGERALLEEYRTVLLASRPKGRGPPEYPWPTFVRHWETALVDWCRFQASWGFWGNTEWLEARVRSIVADDEWRAWLKSEVAA